MSMLQSIWANGMSGWWAGRQWYYMLYSAVLLALLAAGARVLYGYYKEAGNNARKASHIILISLLVYLLWAFFFQNIVHKPRHILPVIPFICLLVAAGLAGIARARYAAACMALYIIATGFIVRQHLRPAAISQMKDQLMLYQSEKSIFRAAPIINYYMIKQGWTTGKVYRDTADIQPLKAMYNDGYTVLSMGNIDSLLQADPVETIEFNHDPYVSRMWSHLTLYRYQRR
jgi:hypothetical protein